MSGTGMKECSTIRGILMQTKKDRPEKNLIRNSLDNNRERES